MILFIEEETSTERLSNLPETHSFGSYGHSTHPESQSRGGGTPLGLWLRELPWACVGPGSPLPGACSWPPTSVPLPASFWQLLAFG